MLVDGARRGDDDTDPDPLGYGGPDPDPDAFGNGDPDPDPGVLRGAR
jgi:hypothetical protein